MITLPYSLVIEATKEADFSELLLSRLGGGSARHRALNRGLPLQGTFGDGRSRADAARARLSGACARSQSDDRDSERGEIAASLTAEGTLRHDTYLKAWPSLRVNVDSSRDLHQLISLFVIIRANCLVRIRAIRVFISCFSPQSF